MKRFFIAFCFIPIAGIFGQDNHDNPVSAKHPVMLVIHGGAGTILKSQMSPEKEKAYRDTLTIALQKGYAVLKSGGSALDAVEAVVRIMEDCPLFNAGRGSVFTNEGKNEMDAAIMDGKTLSAGSVASVTTIKNPVSAARVVMEKSNHVMLVGRGAEQFAKSQGIEIVDPSYFYTQDRWKALQRAKKEDSIKAEKQKPGQKSAYAGDQYVDRKFGTVGAVAIDRYGNLAAATSTGGITNKRFGRVGDAPIIGAGTYANNATCAISCTGYGEFFIRLVVAKSVSDLMEYKHYSLQQATDEMIQNKVPQLGGSGGLIAVDKDGNFAMPFDTEGMYRGYIKDDGTSEVKIYKGE
ncbi:MAG TPA: isoaspartyl peptidase/L-asparaginase [Puia sp.]|nr:isoaspartyl peptidase/L-asparaginase [Puia sp.]